MANSKKSSMIRWGRSFTLGLMAALITAIPVKAAEKILFIYEPLTFTIRIESLELFAKEGTINQNLELYLRRTTPEEREAFRAALLRRSDVNPVLLSRFFNTEIGEDILTRIGKLINIQGGSNGKYALRAALIQAALDPEEGLTLLNFLRKLPTNMQIDVGKAIALSQEIDLVLEATNFFNDKLFILAAQEAAAAEPIDFSALPDLTQRGDYGVEQRKIILTDESRQRTFYVIIHQPKRWRSGKTPVVVYSHGLASRPEDFRRWGEYLASYGYVVVLPQHPGSDFQQAQNLLKGYSREVFDRQEFINRPLDISYVIDELERRNATEFGGRLDLENVGVGGHSFGGYTALAVAGAKIDFEFLQAECDRQFSGLNISLLLQCRALELPRKEYNFRDPRVKAVLGNNPVNSSVFGKKGLGEIQIPVRFGAGSYDPATPAVLEQVRSFVWLNPSDKYLFLIEGQAHVDFSELDAGVSELIESASNLTLASPDLIDRYNHAITLAFFEVHVAKNESFRPYLQSAYAIYLSQGQEFKCHLITAASSDELAQVIQEFRAKHGRN